MDIIQLTAILVIISIIGMLVFGISALLSLLGVAIAIGFYMLPSIIAFMKKTNNRWWILALNVVLGATGLVWIVTLIWALVDQKDVDGY